MKFRMDHENLNVFDMERSVAFYEKALGLHVIRERKAPDGSFRIVFMGNDTTDFQLELTWTTEYDRPYDLGDCEFHLCFRTDDLEGARKLHEEMGCVCFVNPAMGVYFIQDPDGYWLEILPSRRPL